MASSPGAGESRRDLLAPLARVTETVGRVAVWVGGFAFVAVSLLIGVEVLSRKLFTLSLGGADEISGYVLAIASAWAFAFALHHRAHVRIDALHARLPARLAALLDLLSLMSLGVFATLLTWWASQLLSTSVEYGSTANTPLQTPLWIPQTLWVAGLAFFCAALLLQTVRAAWALLVGDLRLVRQVAGVRTVGDELDDEIGRPPG